MVPAQLQPLVTAERAAELCQVRPVTIRQWVHRGHLSPATGADGQVLTDGQGRQLYRQLDVARAEHKTRRRARRVLTFRAA